MQSGGFSPDGTIVWTCTSRELCLWQTTTGFLLAPALPIRSGARALWSVDGTTLAATDDKRAARLWDLTPGTRPLAEMRAFPRFHSSHGIDPEGTLYPDDAPARRLGHGARGAGRGLLSAQPRL